MQLRGAFQASQQQAIPGILGGLGPLAHIELERRLLQQRQRRGPVQCDQDYPVWLTVSASDTPDRTRSINQSTPDCLAALCHYARLLQQMGSDFLLVPCNTSHAFYDAVQAELEIPWLHLMRSTTDYIRECYPQVRSVGVLSTDGTLREKLYHHSLQQAGLKVVAPRLQSSLQTQVMQSIYAPRWGIKSSGTQVSDTALELLSQAVHCLKARGAELVIAGCTELSVAFPLLGETGIPWVDPLEIVADLALAIAYGDRLLQPTAA